MQQQWTISRSDCDMRWKVDVIWQLATISSVIGLRRSSKVLPKARLAPKKRSWSLFGGLLPVWSDKLSESITSESMLSRSVRCTENCSACSQHWLTGCLHDSAWPHIAQPSLQKLNELVFQVLPHLLYSPDLLPVDYHSFKHLDNFFTVKMLPQPAGGRKCFPRVESWSTGFYATWINKNVFLIDKNVLIVRVPILINKDMFEPSYNDLKFTVWNHNYFCTNLIEFACEAIWSWSFVCWKTF